jgi:aryl-alcohol dehydrogenase-like predicted oxidoreductase
MRKFAGGRLSTLTLGTVQIGLPYGKVLHTQPPPSEIADAILDTAWRGGITCFDTAHNYGIAETRIGIWRRRTNAKPLLISKLPPFDPGFGDAHAFVKSRCSESLSRLGVTRLDGYLIHRPADLDVPGLVDSVRGCVEEGLASTYGVSVYTPTEFERALSLCDLGAIQAPVSVFDRRLAEAGLLERAAEQGVAVFVRSIFLQGAAFIDPKAPPPSLAAIPAITQISDAVCRLRAIAAREGVPAGALALQATASTLGVASVVVGVNSPGQIEEILGWSKLTISLPAVQEAMTIGQGLTEDAIDPRRWPRVT